MKTKNKSIIYILKTLIQIFIITVVGFSLMILISPNSKALQVFLFFYSIYFIIIVLIAIYINYTIGIYKEIRKK